MDREWCDGNALDNDDGQNNDDEQDDENDGVSISKDIDDDGGGDGDADEKVWKSLLVYKQLSHGTNDYKLVCVYKKNSAWKSWCLNKILHVNKPCGCK